MSRVLVVLFLAAVAQTRAATVKGTVILNEVGGPPVANVQIIDSAHTGGPWASGSDGGFTLEYPKRQSGQRVRLLVSKEGYVVINDVQLDLALPADPDANPLEILICKEADREEMARRFYRLKSNEAIETTYQQKLKALEEEHRADAVALAQLQQERDQARAAAEKASEQLAKNAPGQSSELYQEAKRLFLEGKINEAINLLNDEELRQSLAQAKKAIADVVQAWLLKAQLLTVQFRFDAAEEAYKSAIAAAPDDFTANFTFANFNNDLKRYQEAATAYSRCVELARKNQNNSHLAATLNNLGGLDRDQNRMQEARNEFAEALKTYRELAQKNPDVNLPDVAMSLNNLGLLDSDQNRIEEARKELAEALKTYRELAQKNPDVCLPGVASTLNNLGVLNADQNRMEDARKEFAEALKTYRELAQKNPNVYLPDVAMSLNNLGVLDREQNRMEDARKEYTEALKTYRELVQKNPDAYLPNVAGTLNHLGVLDQGQNRMEEARKEYTEALKTYRELAQKNPDVYLPNIAGLLNNLGLLDRDQNRMEEAREEYAEALQIRRELAQKNPDVYLPDVAATLNNLGGS
jgi:tetratricopeptide (TPR) repeat protein